MIHAERRHSKVGKDMPSAFRKRELEFAKEPKQPRRRRAKCKGRWLFVPEHKLFTTKPLAGRSPKTPNGSSAVRRKDITEFFQTRRAGESEEGTRTGHHCPLLTTETERHTFECKSAPLQEFSKQTQGDLGSRNRRTDPQQSEKGCNHPK